uniref:Zinc knuckle CX2CX4HX4C domain-containing protein n=1 Tax=Cannabis sativa TaxID=3483 RepID=A0A803P229_CANSA
MNINMPLKRRMKFRRRGRDTFYANFKYERVPTFCFICGIMGHSERFCGKLYDTLAYQIDKPYSIDMRAPSRRHNFLVASPWLRTAKPATTFGTEAGEDGDQETNSFPQSKATFTPRSNPNKAKNIVNDIPEVNDRDLRDIDLNVVREKTNQGIVIHSNDSTFMYDADLTILDLKRKRAEVVSKNIPRVGEEVMDQPIIPNNGIFVNVDVFSKNGYVVGSGFEAHQSS